MPCWRANIPYGYDPPTRDGVDLWDDTPGMYEPEATPDKQDPDIYQAMRGRRGTDIGYPTKTE